jgi:tetratricopeptide (TPR) repeat protein
MSVLRFVQIIVGDVSLTKLTCDSVQVWEDRVTIPTYPEQPADKNPMFLEKRVYQGSSGKVYPNPFTDRVSNEKRDKTYHAVFLENEYIHLMMLPEIGGRIHVGQDKTNGYDFFYRQTVIKPALVGLLGPWISGGVEFNWPQHHRPSTYMPVQHTIEHHADGSVTVWLSEHEPMQRMKGMAGISLHPGKAYIEAKARVYNRTPFVQTFLWWANVGVHVHDEYQAFFPPDVTYVADHAKRAVSSFPVARNFYYGVDYRKGVDISWYKNIPVPTSYMVTESKYDFFGGYDHKRKAGVVHVANHHIAPGKKLWTWGNAEFGYAWDRNLTDSDGPYIELMAGVYTDNQPDFSWLQPYETRSWSQFWYPIQEIGPAKNANRQAAVSFEQQKKAATIGVCVTKPFAGATVVIGTNGESVFEEQVDLAPGKPFLKTFSIDSVSLVRLVANDGTEIIRYVPEGVSGSIDLPAPASEPPAPKDIASNDELYVTGLHLEQYRHATAYPEPYWEEVLRRDPSDSRCNTELGLLKLRRGQFVEAEVYFRRSIQRLTERNPNPPTSNAHYYLGLTLQYQDRFDEAYSAYYKASWNYGWQSAGYYRLAQIDCCREDFDAALSHLERSLATNEDHLHSRNLKTAVLRRLRRRDEALADARTTSSMDPVDFWSRNELRLLSIDSESDSISGMESNVQLNLDLAFDYASAGFWNDANELLTRLANQPVTHPMVLYALADFSERSGDQVRVSQYRIAAAKASPDYCFPSRLDELKVLQAALKRNPDDAKGHYYLGNLLYDKKRYEEAIQNWEASAELDPSFSTVWRNLGIAYFNIRNDPRRALDAYEKAFACDQEVGRVLYELDQLRKRIGFSAAERLTSLERHPALREQRDDLTIEFITLLNESSESEEALRLLSSRRFNPWEGGEGLVSGQYVWAHLLIGRSQFEQGNPEQALTHFAAARVYPRNLGEGKHLLTNETHLNYFSGRALSQLGRHEEARAYWSKAVEGEPPITWMSYYRALSYRALGRDADATRTLDEMRSFAKNEMHAKVKVDYFATSLPNFLLFEDDLDKRNRVDCQFLIALSELGQGNRDAATTLLNEVLILDPNHLAAQAELRSLERVQGQAPALLTRR